MISFDDCCRGCGRWGGGEGRGGAMFISRHPVSAVINLQNGRPKITEMCIKKMYK